MRQRGNRRKQVFSDGANARAGASRNARPTNDERHEQPAFRNCALAACQRRIASRRAVIRGEDDVGVVGDAQLVELLKQHAQGNIQVQVSRRFGGFPLAQAPTPLLHRSECLRAGIASLTGRIVRELEIEGLARLDLPGHETHSPLRHRIELLGVRVGDVVRPAVAVGAVVLLEPMLAGTNAAHVPFAKVRRRVTGALEHLGDGNLAGGQFSRSRRCDDAAVGIAAAVPPALVHEGHVQLRRALAGEEGGARRSAAGRRRVETCEAHPARRQLLQVGRTDIGALGAGHRIIHLHRGAAPAVALAQDDDEVGLRQRKRSAAKNAKQRRDQGHRHELPRANHSGPSIAITSALRQTESPCS